MLLRARTREMNLIRDWLYLGCHMAEKSSIKGLRELGNTVVQVTCVYHLPCPEVARGESRSNPDAWGFRVLPLAYGVTTWDSNAGSCVVDKKSAPGANMCFFFLNMLTEYLCLILCNTESVYNLYMYVRNCAKRCP
jgi:hypothetical protein